MRSDEVTDGRLGERSSPGWACSARSGPPRGVSWRARLLAILPCRSSEQKDGQQQHASDQDDVGELGVGRQPEVDRESDEDVCCNDPPPGARSAIVISRRTPAGALTTTIAQVSTGTKFPGHVSDRCRRGGWCPQNLRRARCPGGCTAGSTRPPGCPHRSSGASRQGESLRPLEVQETCQARADP